MKKPLCLQILVIASLSFGVVGQALGQVAQVIGDGIVRFDRSNRRVNQH